MHQSTFEPVDAFEPMIEMIAQSDRASAIRPNRPPISNIVNSFPDRSVRELRTDASAFDVVTSDQSVPSVVLAAAASARVSRLSVQAKTPSVRTTTKAMALPMAKSDGR